MTHTSHFSLPPILPPSLLPPSTAAQGFARTHPANPMDRHDSSYELLASMNGFSGTPPQVYGVLWNPFRPTNGLPGSEFVSYGLRHIK